MRLSSISLIALICALMARANAESITFTKDVAPIVFKQCSICHRPGQSGPFALMSYADVKKRAKEIAAVTLKRVMPPWLPESEPGEFLEDRRLTDRQIQVFQQWLTQGTPEGSLLDLPPMPQWREGWQLGQPDLILEMPKKYVLSAEGRDIYRNFTIPTALTTPRYVRAVEFKPDNRRIVHHAAMAVDYEHNARKLEGSDGQPGFDYNMISPDGVRRPEGYFLNWTPGNLPSFDSPGFGWTLEPGQELVLQTHLKPTGKPEELQVQIGLYFADTPPTKRVFVFTLNSFNIDIPAGANAYVIEDRFVLPVDLDLLAVLPHAHYLGKQLEAFAHLPDGTRKRLLRIPAWDFDWQDDYRYANPVHLPSGTTLQMRYVYDNSAANPKNPNQPPKPVRYGSQTKDEMGDIRFQVLVPNEQALRRLAQAAHEHQIQTFVSYDEFLLNANPHDAQARTRLGLIQSGRGQWAAAADSFRKAISDDPTYDAPHYYMGLMYRSRKQFSEARAEFETAIRLNPKNSKAHANLGITLGELGELGKAEASLREALRLNPADSAASGCLDELRRRRHTHPAVAR